MSGTTQGALRRGQGRDPINRRSKKIAWLRSRPMYQAWANAKKRAKQRGISFDITVEDLMVPQFCPVLGLKLEFNWGGKSPSDSSPSIDRIEPRKGYVKGNVRVISNRANRIKADATIEELELVLMDEKSRML